MLEKKDIEIIKIAVGEVVNERFDAIEQRFDAMDERMDSVDERMEAMDERMEAMEERMDEKFASMDEKFASMDEKFTSMDEKFASMDEKFASMDEKFASMDEKFTSIVKQHERKIDLVLDEVVRVHESVQGQINKLEESVNELKQYYRIEKLENDSMAILIQHVDDLDRRVEKLENKTA